MDKILELGDIFGPQTNNFNALLLIPIVSVLVGSVLVYLCGMAKTESQQSTKIETSASGKRKKRQPATEINPREALTKQQPSRQATTQQQQQKTDNAVKLSPAKKSQVHVAAKVVPRATAKAQKQKTNKVEVAVNNKPTVDTEGEWQTVINKKQQKKSLDPLIQAVAEAAAHVAKKNVKSPKKTKPSKAPEKENREQHTLNVAAPTAAAVEVDNHPVTTVTDEHVAATEAVVSNLAFDELGEAAWTENKPQKKTKKRALRE